MIDKQFRLFGKVSIVDIGLIGGVVVLVIFLIQFASPTVANAKNGDQKIRYTVEIASKELGFVDNIIIGEKLYDSVRGYDIGIIVDKYTTPERTLVPDFDAEVIRETAVDGLECIYVVVEATAAITTDATTLSGEYEVLVGKAVYIKSKDFASAGYVVVIEQIE